MSSHIADSLTSVLSPTLSNPSDDHLADDENAGASCGWISARRLDLTDDPAFLQNHNFLAANSLALNIDELSIVTGTNSTDSSLWGAGRTVDKLLSSGGRQVDIAIAAIGQRLGFGLNASVARFFAVSPPDASECGRCSDVWSELSSLRQPSVDDILECLGRLGCQMCLPILQDYLMGPRRSTLHDLCRKFVKAMW
jgi:hypothetical protein